MKPGRFVPEILRLCAVLCIISLVFTACPDGSSSGETIDVTFSSVTADGDETLTTKKLTLTFSQAITGLSADDITLSGVDGITKGVLVEEGTDYTLPIGGFGENGELSVTVQKAGYNVIGSPKTVYIYLVPLDVTFDSLTANGNAGQTTTLLTLTFSEDIDGLTADDITLDPGDTGAEKNILVRKGTGTYDLVVTGIAADGDVAVEVNKAGFIIDPDSLVVAVHFFPPPPFIDSLNAGRLVRIDAGTFTMGSPAAERRRYSDENQHEVTLTQGFYMGEYPVTQKQWFEVMGTTIEEQQKKTAGNNIDFGRGDNFPVYYISWYEAIVFCNKLSMLESITPAYSIDGETNPDEWGDIPESDNALWDTVTIEAGSNGYRLPTEAQWEYACRGGTTTAFCNEDNYDDGIGYNAVEVGEVAWFSINSEKTAHEVGQKNRNDWDLYDMHGNVFEWCWDWYGGYLSDTQVDPEGAAYGDYRVMRGGSWYYPAVNSRSACRYWFYPSFSFNDIGFRLVRP